MPRFLKSELKNLITRDTKYTCQVCKEEFTSRDEAIQHIKDAHSDMTIMKALDGEFPEAEDEE